MDGFRVHRTGSSFVSGGGRRNPCLTLCGRREFDGCLPYAAAAAAGAAEEHFAFETAGVDSEQELVRADKGGSGAVMERFV